MHWLNSVYRSFGNNRSPEPGNANYAKSLRDGENEIREFKPFIVPANEKEFEVVKSAVAFANTDGGTIFVGVDNEGVPLGIGAARRCFRTLDPIEAQRSRLKSLITDNTKPVPSVTYAVVDVNGSRLVVAEVKKSPTVCSTQDNRVYVRRGSTSRLADPHTELPSLIRGSGLDFEPWESGTNEI
jgi:ATP-dependent DNA helicase RecG